MAHTKNVIDTCHMHVVCTNDAYFLKTCLFYACFAIKQHFMRMNAQFMRISQNGPLVNLCAFYLCVLMFHALQCMV